MFAIMDDLRSQLAEPETRLRIQFPAEIMDAGIPGPTGNGIFISDDPADAYRKFFIGMNEGAAILDAGRIVVEANSRLAEILGIRPEKISGVTFSNWIAPQDREIFETLFQMAWRGTPARCVLRLFAGGDSRTPVLFSLAPQPGGIHQQVSVVVVDLFPPPRFQTVLLEPEIESPTWLENGAVKFGIPEYPPEAFRPTHPLFPTRVRFSKNLRKDPATPGTSENPPPGRNTPQRRNPDREWKIDPEREIITTDDRAPDLDPWMLALLQVLSAPGGLATRIGRSEQRIRSRRHYLQQPAGADPTHPENTEGSNRSGIGGIGSQDYGPGRGGNLFVPVPEGNRATAWNTREHSLPADPVRIQNPTVDESEYAAIRAYLLKEKQYLFKGILEDNREAETMENQANLAAWISDGIVAVNMEGRIQSWNSSAERMFGWTADEVIARPVDEILQTEFPHASGETVLRKVMENGSWKGAAIQHHRNGIRFAVRITLSLLRDRAGAPIGLVEVNRDLPEWKNVETDFPRSSFYE